MTAAYRAPTVTEAVDWLLTNAQPWARWYRRDCILFWRELVGESFVVQVEREFRKRWSKRKGREAA